MHSRKLARRPKTFYAAVAFAIIVGGMAVLYLLTAVSNRVDELTEPSRSFAGSSTALSNTSVLPTLDSPIPENTSAIWSIGFPLAWNELRNLVDGEPVRIAGAETVCTRLNSAKHSKMDVDAHECVAVAGRIEDGILTTIRELLSHKFPDATMPPIQDNFEDGRAVVAFAYLSTQVSYKYQFKNNSEWLSFRDENGKYALVRSFGLPLSPEKGEVAGYSREQVRVLFHEGKEFAVDLSHRSTPNMIVLAKIKRQPTLEAMLESVEQRMAESRPCELPYSGTLFVPNMNWLIEHHYDELEGFDRVFLNRGLEGFYMKSAQLVVDCKIDRFGCHIDSGAYTVAEILGDGEPVEPEAFHFDSPFLMIVKNRNSQHPLFVMWVANAELLCGR